MENLLNACWSLLVVGALVTWLRQATLVHRTRQHVQLVALLCVLALMFPVISATDDLHSTPQAIEDSSKRTQKAWGLTKCSASRLKDGTAPTLPAVAIVVPQPGTIEWFQLTAVPSVQGGLRPRGLGRSPPILTF